MLKDRNAANVLENIVGTDNFSEDPAIISSYTLMAMSAGKAAGGKDMFDVLKMGAVIMPGSVNEVQAILRVCNRHKIHFKALSTGMHSGCLPLKEGSLQIDMRRMNRILKLDEKNMYAVVEPYVSFRQLSVEAMKKGLTCHIIGAGSQTSPLASVTSGWGTGHSATTTSHSARNCLGAEWVLPTGDIVRWGLVEEGKVGYPGPGLSGIYKGYHGAFGALGVFTKAAVKLYPWPGPVELEMTGRSPTLGYKIPDNFKVYLLSFPSAEKVSDATYKMIDARIAYHIWHMPLFFHPQRWMGESNDDHYDIWEKIKAAGLIEKNLDGLVVVVASYSQKELAYKEKVMNEIINEAGGQECLPGQLSPHDIERFFCAQIAVHKPCTEFRLGAGDMGTSMGQILNWDTHMKIKKVIRDMQKKYVEQGVLTDVACESCWGGPMEQRAYGHTEYVHFTNPAIPEFSNGQVQFIEETEAYNARERLFGTSPLSATKAERDMIASKYLDNYFDYKKKIKEVFDPNDIAESTMYLGPR